MLDGSGREQIRAGQGTLGCWLAISLEIPRGHCMVEGRQYVWDQRTLAFHMNSISVIKRELTF